MLPARFVQVVSVWAASSLMPPVRVVLVRVRLLPLVWPVWLSCLALVVSVSVVPRVSSSLAALLVVFWRLVPVVVLRW